MLVSSSAIDGAVGKGGEHQPAAGRERAAVVRIGDVGLGLDLAGDRIGGGHVGFVALDRLLVPPRQPAALLLIATGPG